MGSPRFPQPSTYSITVMPARRSIIVLSNLLYKNATVFREIFGYLEQKIPSCIFNTAENLHPAPRFGGVAFGFPFFPQKDCMPYVRNTYGIQRKRDLWISGAFTIMIHPVGMSRIFSSQNCQKTARKFIEIHNKPSPWLCPLPCGWISPPGRGRRPPGGAFGETFHRWECPESPPQSGKSAKIGHYA